MSVDELEVVLKELLAELHIHVQLSHLNNPCQQLNINLIFAYLLKHLFFVVEYSVLFVVLDDRLDDIPVKSETILFKLPVPPGAGIEDINFGEKGRRVDDKEIVILIFLNLLVPYFFADAFL